MLVSTVHADVNHYMPLQLIDPQDKLKDLSFDGSLFGASWKPLLVELSSHAKETWDFAIG